MTPADLLSVLRQRGYALRVAAGKLLVSPAARLAPEERLAIQEHRDGLIAALEAEAIRPFVGLPPPDSPHWLTAAAWVEGWAALCRLDQRRRAAAGSAGTGSTEAGAAAGPPGRPSAGPAAGTLPQPG